MAENDKLVAGVKKRLLEVIAEFMAARPAHVATYLQPIKETALRTFAGDPNSLVKEAALQLLLKILRSYPNAELTKIFEPTQLLTRLLDEIKLRRPSASVKGTIWHLVGLCHVKFG